MDKTQLHASEIQIHVDETWLHVGETRLHAMRLDTRGEADFDRHDFDEHDFDGHDIDGRDLDGRALEERHSALRALEEQPYFDEKIWLLSVKLIILFSIL